MVEAEWLHASHLSGLLSTRAVSTQDERGPHLARCREPDTVRPHLALDHTSGRSAGVTRYPAITRIPSAAATKARPLGDRAIPYTLYAYWAREGVRDAIGKNHGRHHRGR